MTIWVSGIFIVLACLIAIPIAVLFVECVAACFPARKVARDSAEFKTVILMPAHNEAAVIANTLQKVKPQLNTNTSLLVIADNCSDETADIVRQHGLQVVERFDANDRGKGFALDYGLHQLDAAPPDVIVMMDADCVIADNGVADIAAQAHTQQRPVQAVYLIDPPQDPALNDLVSAFAFQVKNLVRPKGLHNLGQPCLLTGTGMAFPWELIRNAPLASGNIVEDMQLGFDLALAGAPPQLAPDVIVWSELPQQREAATSQRTRWEHGHLQTLLQNVPTLLKESVRQRRFDLFALALDLLIPPLALVVLIWVGIGAISRLFGMISSNWVAATIVGFAGVFLSFAIGLAWIRFGRSILSLSKLLAIPLYIAWKIPLYLKFIVQRQTAWVRTERDSTSPTP